MPEIKLNTLEIFQWKVNPSRRVPDGKQNLGVFCSSLTEAISSQALLPQGEGQTAPAAAWSVPTQYMTMEA